MVIINKQDCSSSSGVFILTVEWQKAILHVRILFWILRSGIWAVPLLVKAVSPWLITREVSLLLWVIDEWLLQKEKVIIKLKLFSSFTRVFFGWGDCQSPWQLQAADMYLQSWVFNFLLAVSSTLWDSEEPWVTSCVFIHAPVEMHFATTDQREALLAVNLNHVHARWIVPLWNKSV